MKEYFTIESQEGERIDRYLAEELEDQSRSYIQKLIKEEHVLVNGKPVKANYRLLAGDNISLSLPEIKEPDIPPEKIPLDILYEDQDLLVVNKPKQMVVHPAPGHYTGTLVNALMYHCGSELSGINGVMRPGIVHRIDMDTTGSLVVCKTDAAHQCLSAQLKEHSIHRIYEAIVHGNLKEDSGTVNAPIGRHPTDRKKMSVSEFRSACHAFAQKFVDIQMTSFNFRTRPSAINTPQTGIYFLLESMPSRVDLDMPDDAFRFNRKGIEFVNMETNTVNEEKSRKFTQMLSDKGFRFPPKEVSGNPTTMKEYDNGYLLIDADGNLFHMKQTRGLPYVKALPVPVGIKPAHVFITEFRDRKMLGLLTDTNHRLYAIMADGSIALTGVPGYNPEQDEITIFGNMFDWTVRIASPENIVYYGIKASDFSLLKQYEIPSENTEIPGLSFTSPYDQYVRPRI